jgi:YVTN family beta-propeller protein
LAGAPSAGLGGRGVFRHTDRRSVNNYKDNAMLRSTAWGFLSAVIALGTAALAAAQEGTLVVANRDGGSISLIDFPTRIEIARLPIGPTIPHEAAVSPDGRYALTGEYGPNGDPGRHIVLIDITGARIVGRIDLGPDSRPHTALFHPDGRHAVATMQDSDLIALVDLESMTVERTYPTGGREGHMVRLSPDGSRAYVTSRGAQGTLSVIFLEEDRSFVVIDTGAGAEGIAVSPDGREVWVANRDLETISVVDTASLEVVATVASRPHAGRVDIGLDGRAIAPNGGGGGIVAQYLQVFDVASRTVLDEVALRDGTPQDGNFGILLRGSTAFVSDPDAGTIRLFDLDRLADAPELIAAAHEGPDGMAWSPLRVGVMTGESN